MLGGYFGAKGGYKFTGGRGAQIGLRTGFERFSEKNVVSFLLKTSLKKLPLQITRVPHYDKPSVNLILFNIIDSIHVFYVHPLKHNFLRQRLKSH